MFPLVLATLTVDPWDLVRVDVPDHPGAETTSAYGSMLLEAPDDLAWRPESVPEVDGYTAQGALDALDVEPWHEAGVDGAGVRVAVFDLQWYNAELRAEELGEYTTHDCFAHRSCQPEMDTLRP
ncbi:MAG: hypothetical protein QGG40_07310, partial [Myxococcota bacterium]|nr:hypothetical protein [Myxococcota bacterium]